MRERGTLSLFPLWKINVFIAYYPHPKSCIYKLNSSLIILKQRKKQRKTPLRVLWKKRPSCSVNARVVFSNYAGNFCQLCWKFPEVSSIVWTWYAFCSGMVISRNKFFACLQILHHIQHGGLRRMLYLCNPLSSTYKCNFLGADNKQ